MNILNTNIKNKNITLKNYFKHNYGINNTLSIILCKELGLSENFLFSFLTKKDLRKIHDIIYIKKKIKLESDLKKELYDNIKLLKQLKNYKGLRHSLNLPVRGQNTKNNAKTQKWKKKK